MDNIGSRLKSLRKAIGYTQKNFALFLNSKTTGYQKYELNYQIPGSEKLILLKENLLGINKDLNLNWLLTGQGEMFLSVLNKEEEDSKKLSSNEKILIDLFKKLNKDGQEYILMLIRRESELQSLMDKK